MGVQRPDRRLSLPAPLPLFLDREGEVAAVCNLLRRPDVRLLTLPAPGGTNKTRLALKMAAELAELFADRATFGDLAPICDPALVLVVIAHAMGMGEPEGIHLSTALIETAVATLDGAAGVAEFVTGCPTGWPVYGPERFGPLRGERGSMGRTRWLTRSFMAARRSRCPVQPIPRVSRDRSTGPLRRRSGARGRRVQGRPGRGSRPSHRRQPGRQ